MNDTELAGLLGRMLNASVNVYTDLEDDQADALDYYYGRPYGNEQEGRSQVVTREVLETIEWIKPSLLRIFASGKKVVEFDPTGPEDEAAADQETDIINTILTSDNNWFRVCYDWIHDALLQKVGYVKVSWDVTDKKRTETYQGLTDMELAQVIEGGEAIEHDSYPSEIGMLHNVTVEYIEQNGKVLVEPVPGDEIRVASSTRSVSLCDSEFVSHSRGIPASDLIEMGIDRKIVDSLMGEETEEELEIARDQYADTDTDDEVDDSRRTVHVDECYALVDYDGDGIAERRRILMSGKVILQNDVWDEVPVIALSPVPQPHKHIGLGEADLVMDIQLIKSTLTRQVLDNLYRTNNPEKEVVWHNVLNPDSLMESVPGGIKPVKEAGSINPLVVPFTAQHTMPMLEVLDGMKEVRTGISRHTQGLDADALAQSTKGAFMGAIKQANQRLEMIARIFAETGFKELFRMVHKIMLQNQDKQRWVKLKDQWIPVDPREWHERDDMTVIVGTGSGNDDEMISKLVMLADRQEAHMMNGSPLVSFQNLYNTYEQIIEKADLKDVTRYFTDPKTIQPQPPQPSDSDKMIQAQMQIEQLKAQVQAQKIQSDQMIAERDFQLKQMGLQSQERNNVARLGVDEEKAAAQAQIDMLGEKLREAEALMGSADADKKLAIEKYKADLQSETQLALEKMRQEHEGARQDKEAERKAAEVKVDAPKADKAEPATPAMPEIHIHQGGRKRISVKRNEDGSLEGQTEDVDED